MLAAYYPVQHIHCYWHFVMKCTGPFGMSTSSLVALLYINAVLKIDVPSRLGHVDTTIRDFHDSLSAELYG